jgi:hypothetical protein
MGFLRWLVYQGRSFRPDMRDSKWRKDNNVTDYKTEGPYTHLKSEDLFVTFTLPKAYPSKTKEFYDYPRKGPWPTLVVLHDKEDFTGKKYPGMHALKRVWPKETSAALYDEWISFVPVAAAGNYTTDDGQVRREVLLTPFITFAKHYHVDFERIILDGGESALAAAAAIPSWFAGIVLRGAQMVKTDAQKQAVGNYAHVPVYVVGCPHTAKALKDAGHTKVTLGPDTGVYEWMQAQRRTTPRKFSWRVGAPDQTLPYWINFDQYDPAAPEKTIAVEVVDTEKEPNTIKITARAIQALTLFLNDEIVNLDRPVRVEINGHIEYEGVPELTSESVKPIKRDLDVLFNREPAQIRLSMFFGWLYPTRLLRLDVRDPKVTVTPAEATEPAQPAPAAATADQEEEAKRYREKAEYYIEKGEPDSAQKMVERIIDLPVNAQTAWAKAKLAELTSQGVHPPGK